MALTLHLKYVENLKGRAERLAKVSFRGLSHYTKTIENAEDSVVFDEYFEWPVARPVEAEEVIDIQIFNYNKYLSNRLVGTFRMILQELIEVGNTKINDCLLDTNNVVMKTTVTFELSYNAPDGSVGLWQKGGFEKLRSNDLRRGLSAEEQQEELDKFETSSMMDFDEKYGDSQSMHSLQSAKSGGKGGSMLSLVSTKSSKSTKSTKSNKSHGSRALSSVMKMAMLMRQKPAGDTNDEDNRTLTGNEDLDPDSSDLDAKAAEVASMLAAHNRNVDDEPTGNLTVPASLQAKKGKATLMSDDNLMKAQDFQVCVTIIEARQLAGLNMDPVVCVQVGDQRKYTSVKESTNCPYYNEYFVFDFHMPPLMLFDKIISLTVCQSGRIMKTSRVMGSYKLDVSTVYAQQDHQFYHKWAMLMDPDDINGGIKGYLKCDIAVIGKGDSVKVPPKSDKDDDDIEANLLLPDGVPADRQKARYVIKLYRAEGLPKMNTGIMANVKKAFTGEKFDLTDPYVEVNFAGHKGKTSVRKGCYEPVWNEQVVFTEMFPPLCRRIKVQLRDSDSVNDDNIGTHYIDLSAISNEGEKGFLPTYGPAWVNLYGSTRYYQLLEKHGHLNDGLGEGVSFRGRLLIAVKTEIIDGEELGATQVETEPAQPISENAAGHKDEYFLFGSFIEATMIDRKVGDKPVHFEVSVGNAGNVLDGYNAPCRHSMDSDSDGEEGSDREDDKLTSSIETPQWVSTTPAAKPLSKDNCYFHLPFYENKPCVYAKDMFEDHRRRMYNSNIIDKICEKLDDGLAEAQVMIEEEQPFPEVKLRTVFEELGQGCSKFVSLVKGTGGGSAAGKTKLDKERHKLLVRELDQMSTLARTMKATVSKHNMREKLKAGMQYLTKLKGLSREPQHALPDIFIWMISGNKRIAYQRLPARHVVYSIVDEERGKDCGKVITLLLRLPGKKATGSSGWTIQAKLQVFLWLGLSKHKKDFLKGLPKGYDETRALKQASKPSAVPPPFIHYKERQFFQLRAHMYQARQLIGSDASGLSDPFARIAFADQSMATQVIDQTLSPTWDEMLVMKEVVIFGVMDEIVSSPPTIVVEVFDQDKVGKSEFIGRALCKPVVKLSTEAYEPPKFPPRLEWWDIFRGLDRAGELLATFELLQKPFEERDLKAAYLTPPYARKTIGLMPFAEQRSETPEIPSIDVAVNRKDKGPILPVPKGIRPILSKHRIEVLFWGVRDLKRIQLQSVDHPRIDIECAGHVLSSSIILNCKKNPNFNVPVKYFDVELPENELYCPPITIRCVDCRSFGRFTLVGTHVISNIHKFTYVPTTKQAKCAMQRLFPMKGIDSVRVIQTGSPVSVKSEDVAITVDENLPLIHKDQCITIDVNTPSSKDPQKTQDNKKKGKKGEVEGEDEPDMDALDWWSKYFASVETMIRDDQEVEEDHGASEDVFNVKLLEAESKAASDREGMTHAHHNPQNANGSYGSLPNGAKEVEIKQAKKFEKEAKKNTDKEKKATGTPAVASPKTQKRKEKQTSSTAQLKGFFKKIKNLVKKEPEAEEELLIETLVVYPNELESQPQFEGFNDWLHTFELYRGKNTGNDEPDENRVVGKFKGSMKIYKIPLPPDIEDTTVTGGDPAYGLFQGLPSNEPVKILVRVYVVKANDLHPADINGKADPYLVLRLGSKSQNDKDNYISKQLNPVFGKCFEFEATFPMESLLTVQVFDWDLIGVDDLIGESKIDLENRYYSRHRATCGLGQKYELHGYNAWRDPQKPTQVLGKMCKDGKVDGPHYQPGKVRIANRIFMAPMEIEDENAKKAALAKAARKAARNPRVEGVQNPTFEMEDANNNATTKKKKKNTKPATNSSAQPNGQPSNSQPPNGEIEFKPGAKREGKGDDDKDGGHVENDKDKNNKPGTTNDANKNQNAKDKNNDDGVKKATDEHLALAALNNWCEIPKVGGHLVQEHVETRPLFHPEKPGIEQGKLEMFVDMFPMDMPPPGPPVDISPRKPKGFELRCIIWNTDDVVLEDDAFFTGEKMSDIYVKGWIKGSDDMQSTDIHYRSLTGEGNFNWRFVFPFDYLVAEEKIVISRKETLFSWDETESKIPARLNLQVWDADHFSADDFLGSLTLDLNRFPRGAKSAKKCTLDMLKNDGSVPQMSLFKHKRVKGWWPFHVKNEGSEELELTGKVEAELHLMTADEAEKHPAGLGRSEPEPLEKPNRPDASFMWFMNPFKSLKHILWNNYKWLILKILLFILLVLLIGLFFYSMPGYLVKKMFNVRPDSSFMWFMNPFKSLKHILWNNYKWLILKILLFILLVLLIGLFFYSMPGYAVKKMFNARPDSSFMWFMNPFKSLRYILWHNYKWVIIKILLFLLLIILIGLFFYSMPGYTVKKMFNV